MQKGPISQETGAKYYPKNLVQQKNLKSIDLHQLGILEDDDLDDQDIQLAKVVALQEAMAVLEMVALQQKYH